MPRVKGAHTKRASVTNVRALAWRSARILRRFTRPQLQTTVPTLEHANASKYLRSLVAAGYLRVTQERVCGRPGSYRVYQLIRDTGPLCPLCRNNGQVYDQNNNQIYGSIHDA